MGRSWLLSSLLHTALAVLLWFGLPSWGRSLPVMEGAITVELVTEQPDDVRPPEPAVAALAPEPEREAARERVYKTLNVRRAGPGDDAPAVPVMPGSASEVGATASICDGKFTPTAVADCLKQAGDQGADAVVSLFIDYAMAGTAFDALAAKGVPVLIGGVEPTGGRESDDTLAFYDNTGRVGKLYDAMSMSALAQGGEDTNALWLRLMDSTTTRWTRRSIAASTSTRVASDRRRSFIAQFRALAIFSTGGIDVARCTTTSAPSRAARTAAGSNRST